MFECLKSFYLHGNNLVVCGSNSTWQPPILTCYKVTPPTSTKHPTSAKYPTSIKSPVTSGKPPPNEGPLACEDLDKWILALIFITLLELQ